MQLTPYMAETNGFRFQFRVASGAPHHAPRTRACLKVRAFRVSHGKREGCKLPPLDPANKLTITDGSIQGRGGLVQTPAEPVAWALRPARHHIRRPLHLTTPHQAGGAFHPTRQHAISVAAPRPQARVGGSTQMCGLLRAKPNLELMGRI